MCRALAFGFASCDITHETGGRFLRALTSASSDITSETGVRFVTGIGFRILRHHTLDRGYDLLRALGSVSCNITHETRGTTCYGHWVLRLVIIHRRQGLRFVTGIGFCLL